MRCNYSDLGLCFTGNGKSFFNLCILSLGPYLTWHKENVWTRNDKLRAHCAAGGLQNWKRSYCWRPDFLNRFCASFPLQSIKTVRLRLNLTSSLVSTPDLNVRVLLLVRDPRGSLESRRHRQFCSQGRDCYDQTRLCRDLSSDYLSYRELSRQFPGRYKSVYQLEHKYFITGALQDF